MSTYYIEQIMALKGFCRILEKQGYTTFRLARAKDSSEFVAVKPVRYDDIITSSLIARLYHGRVRVQFFERHGDIERLLEKEILSVFANILFFDVSTLDTSCESLWVWERMVKREDFKKRWFKVRDVSGHVDQEYIDILEKLRSFFGEIGYVIFDLQEPQCRGEFIAIHSGYGYFEHPVIVRFFRGRIRIQFFEYSNWLIGEEQKLFKKIVGKRAYVSSTTVNKIAKGRHKLWSDMVKQDQIVDFI